MFDLNFEESVVELNAVIRSAEMSSKCHLSSCKGVLFSALKCQTSCEINLPRKLLEVRTR